MKRKIRPSKRSHENKFSKFSQAESYMKSRVNEEKKLSGDKTSPTKPVKRLEQGLNENMEDYNEIGESEIWWEYNGYRFIKKGKEAGQGFERQEVLIIYNQLFEMELEFESRHCYRLVTSGKEKFYVDVEKSRSGEETYVRVTYSESIDSHGRKHIFAKRTNNLKEILGLRYEL